LRVPDRERLDSIQVLRAIAAIAVVAHHVFRATTIAVQPPTNSLLVPGPSFVQLGALGVDVFFVISGFLMTYISEPYFSGRRSPLDFLAQRFIRIWPPYAVVTAFQCLVLVRHLPYEVPFDLHAHRMLSFLFMPTFNESGLLQPIIGPGWTLNYEMLFYVCFTVVLFMGRRLALLTLVVLLSFLFVLGNLVSNPVASEFLGSPLLFEFLIGAGIGFARKNGVIPRLSRIGAWACIAVAPILLKLLYDFWPNRDERIVVYGIPATILFLGFSSINSSMKWPRWMTVLGDASYSIYLIHTLIIYHVTAHTSELCRIDLCTEATVISSSLAIIAAALGGLIFHKTVEIPLIQKGKEVYWRRRRPKGENAASVPSAPQPSQR